MSSLEKQTPSSGTFYGPSLPAHLSNKESNDGNIGPQVKESNIFGPALPPHLIPKQGNKGNEMIVDEPISREVIGPFIPQEFQQFVANYHEPDAVLEEEEDNDEDCCGPLPLEVQRRTKAHVALEERALQMKLDKLNPEPVTETSREEWMLELPAVHAANLGLGPRQFRSKEGPDLSDRSGWTDTPSSKKPTKIGKTDALKTNAKLREMQDYDAEQEKLAKKARKRAKRDKSLVEQHQDKLKVRKCADMNSSERRPFNRDIDLKVNHFDDAQKKAIMKKAQLLDDRFSQGQSKFL